MRYFKVSPAITHFIGWLLQLHCGTLYRRLSADPSSGMQWLAFVLHDYLATFSATVNFFQVSSSPLHFAVATGMDLFLRFFHFGLYRFAICACLWPRLTPI